MHVETDNISSIHRGLPAVGHCHQKHNENSVTNDPRDAPFHISSLLLSNAPVRADTLNVPTGPYPTIQSALDAAVDTDEILVAPGTYNETIDFLRKAVTLRSSGGRDVTTIDGAGLNKTIVKCTSGETPDTLFEGFTVTNGLAFNFGGMDIANSSPTVRDCIFSDNTGTNSAGGMGIRVANPTITQCLFIGNTAPLGGGITITHGTPALIQCTFVGNTDTLGVQGGDQVRRRSNNHELYFHRQRNCREWGGH
jgi:hypothetical protein